MGCGASTPIPRGVPSRTSYADDRVNLRISQDNCFLGPISNRPHEISIISFAAAAINGQDGEQDSDISITGVPLAIPHNTGEDAWGSEYRASICSSVRPSCEPVVASRRVSQRPARGGRRLSVLSCRSMNSMGGMSTCSAGGMSQCSQMTQKTARAESFSDSSDDESAASDESLFAEAEGDEEDPVDVDDELYFLDVTERNSMTKKQQPTAPRASMGRYDEEIDLDAEIALSNENSANTVSNWKVVSSSHRYTTLAGAFPKKFEYLPETSSKRRKSGKKRGKGKLKVKGRRRGKSINHGRNRKRKKSKSKAKKCKKTLSAKRLKKSTRKGNSPRKMRKPRQAQKLLKESTISFSRKSAEGAEAMNWI